ncbi:alpha-hydroxy acid oxidase [Hydrogenophaga sp.]|uniref:alpha-hydroxy acid oxidase n=1 Tax=Hydrogenophaga sp. TaxID=1904254 RepID=UPI0025BD8198|nr:alpha-hydroxy acid oxidase [Hydrogenophaga sp.]
MTPDNDALPAWHAWLEGGAGDEVTLRDNEAAWQDLRLRPRVLHSLAGSQLRTTLGDRALPHPLFMAPMAHQAALHPQGESASALAAAALGAGYVLSCQASTPLEDIARLVLADSGRGPLWFQLHWLGSRNATLALIQRAAAAGFEAAVLTLDAPVQGFRDRERASGFVLPAGVSSVNLTDRPVPTSLSALLAQAPTWHDLAWLTQHSPLPVWAKGILHPGDAVLAAEHGASGLIVSNHGARQLDTVLATAQALPDIVAANAGRLPLVVDGGVRRGTDVLKALALGADAVMLGRPLARALATDGAQGVARALRQLVDELHIALALCGLTQPGQARSAHLAGDLFAPKSAAAFVNAKNSRLE